MSLQTLDWEFAPAFRQFSLPILINSKVLPVEAGWVLVSVSKWDLIYCTALTTIYCLSLNLSKSSLSISFCFPSVFYNILAMHLFCRRFCLVSIHVIADIDECVDSHNCDENAICRNTDGSFACSCNRTFTGDGRNCSSMPSLILLCRFLPWNGVANHLPQSLHHF